MNTDTHRFKHGEITQKVIGVFFDVFNELGHGFLESVYEKSLELALNAIGIDVRRKIESRFRFAEVKLVISRLICWSKVVCC